MPKETPPTADWRPSKPHRIDRKPLKPGDAAQVVCFLMICLVILALTSLSSFFLGSYADELELSSTQEFHTRFGGGSLVIVGGAKRRRLLPSDFGSWQVEEKGDW